MTNAALRSPLLTKAALLGGLFFLLLGKFAASSALASPGTSTSTNEPLSSVLLASADEGAGREHRAIPETMMHRVEAFKWTAYYELCQEFPFGSRTQEHASKKGLKSVTLRKYPVDALGAPELPKPGSAVEVRFDEHGRVVGLARVVSKPDGPDLRYSDRVDFVHTATGWSFHEGRGDDSGELRLTHENPRDNMLLFKSEGNGGHVISTDTAGRINLVKSKADRSKLYRVRYDYKEGSGEIYQYEVKDSREEFRKQLFAIDWKAMRHWSKSMTPS